jgi:small subunit ribosomal protein S16
MAVVIRLKTMGTKKKIKHRIVVTDSKFPRNGRFLEEVGYWDPSKHPAVMKVKTERVEHWIRNGAKPSDTVYSILKKAGAMTTAPKAVQAKREKKAAAPKAEKKKA